MSRPCEVLVPQVNPNDEQAVLVRWHIERGERIQAGEALATLETTKATFDVEAPMDGYVFFDAKPKTLIAVGAHLAWICAENVAPIVDHVKAADSAPSPAADPRSTRKALQLMRQHGLTPQDFASALPRIEVTDVERLLRERGEQSPAPAEKLPGCERLEQSPAKMLEIRSLSEVYRAAVPSLVALSVACEKVEARLRALAHRECIVSLLELSIYEAARLLGEFPELNGYYAQGQAWRYKTVSIGFAINLDRSLRVPVIHRAAEASQLQICQAVRELSLQYMRGQLQLKDLTGGTFTVTDLSTHGIEHFVPVLNQHQAAILGICAELPGSGRRQLVMSFDHRMADGMQASQFLRQLRERLESERWD